MIKIRSFNPLLVCVIATSLNAQQITFSQPSDTNSAFTNYSILHRAGHKIYVLASGAAVNPEIHIYSDQLEAQTASPVTALRNGNPLAISSNENSATILAEFPVRGMNSYRVISVDSAGSTSLLKEAVVLKTDPGSPWSFAKSPNKSFYLLYKVNNPIEDSITINFTILDKEWDVQESGAIELPYSTEFDRLNPVYIDNSGRIWMTVFDHPLNFRLGSTINLYSYKRGDQKLLHNELQSRENKPIEFYLTFNEQKKETTLHALYAGFFNHDIEGYMTATVNEKLQTVKGPLEYEFGKEFKKEMKKQTIGITRDNIMNYLRINTVYPQDGNNFCSLLSLNYAEYKTMPSSKGIISTRSNSIIEQNPVRTSYQRDGLVKNFPGTDKLDIKPYIHENNPNIERAKTNTEIMRTPLNLVSYPDNPPPLSSNAYLLNTRIYDKYLFLSFSDDLQPGWQQWYTKETFPPRELNTAYFTADSSNIISLAYRHDNKGKLEILVSILDRKTGSLRQVPVPVSGRVLPLLSQPALTLKENEILLACSDTETGAKGICRIAW